uniref:Uncharacterized protein n=1 Tax=viral metagenome TaxID=1070528 RepID=A0A6M3LJ07_9ZZZZ
MKYLTGLIGMWIVSDAILSYTLYLNAPSYEGSKKQTWGRDHWVRAVRGVCGIALMIMGKPKG